MQAAFRSATLGSPVVPLVYMMVHRSSGLGGTAGAGEPFPSARNCSHEHAFTPAASAACAVQTFYSSQSYSSVFFIFEVSAK